MLLCAVLLHCPVMLCWAVVPLMCYAATLRCTTLRRATLHSNTPRYASLCYVTLATLRRDAAQAYAMPRYVSLRCAIRSATLGYVTLTTPMDRALHYATLDYESTMLWYAML